MCEEVKPAPENAGDLLLSRLVVLDEEVNEERLVLRGNVIDVTVDTLHGSLEHEHVGRVGNKRLPKA